MTAIDLDAIEKDLNTIIFISDGSSGSDKIARLLRAERELVTEVRRLSQRPSVEDVARMFAGMGEGEAWPTNWELGGSLTGTRDDEYRNAHMADARRLLAAFPAVEGGDTRG